jgi:hypothetical protein
LETLENALAILRSQGRNDVDPRFMSNFYSKCHLTAMQRFITEVKHHENRQTMPVTNGKAGIVAKSLVGYHYIQKTINKENSHPEE